MSEKFCARAGCGKALSLHSYDYSSGRPEWMLPDCPSFVFARQP